VKEPHGHKSRLRVKEQDSDPTVEGVREIRVPNASVTDEGKGIVSLAYDPAGTGDAEAAAHVLAHAGDDDAHHAVFTAAQHTAIGDGAPHHAQPHDHSAAGDGVTLKPTNLQWKIAGLLEISGGAITVTQSHHTIDTENEEGTDDLNTINGLAVNQFYLFCPYSALRTVVFKHGTGNIFCVGNADISLDDIHDFVLGYADAAGANIYVMSGGAAAGGGGVSDAAFSF